MIIKITQLNFKTIIGLLDHERIEPQTVIIDCLIDYDYVNKDSFINYALLVVLIESTMHKEKFELIETALTVLTNDLKANFPAILNIDITITKPDIIANCEVAVTHRKSFL